MSIIRATIRQCAVAALRADTWAEQRVFDSNNEPLIDALTVGDVAKPYIVVFTDADNMVDVTDGVYSATRNLQLVLEMGVANAVNVEGSEKPQLKFPYTDPAMELLLDMLETQALAAICGDPKSEWGELIRMMVVRIIRVNSPRGGRTEKSVRFAARQVVLLLDTISDPVPGMTIEDWHPVKKFITLAEELQPQGIHDAAHIISSVLTMATYPKWQQDQAWLGLSKRGMRATGQAPLAVTTEPGATPWATSEGADIVDAAGEPPMAAEIDVEDEDGGSVVHVVPATADDPSV